MTTNGRTSSFVRNDALDQLIAELADALRPGEAALAPEGRLPRAPTVFVVGGPRSGTTLTMQVLAASGVFNYPTNVMARFASTPAIGARIQAMLLDERFDFRGELADVGRPISFTSDLGKSRGARQPAEFWYFWRRFFPVEQPRKLTDDELSRVDVDGFVSSFAAIEAVDPRPFALKAMIVMQDLRFLADVLPRSIFVDVRRDPFFQCQSLLEARQRFTGSEDGWYSVEPAGAGEIRDLDPAHQVATQVHLLNQALDRQLDDIGGERTVRTTYGDLCREPMALIDAIAARALSLGHRCAPALPVAAPGSRDVVRADPSCTDAIIRAWEDVTGESLDHPDGARPLREEQPCT